METKFTPGPWHYSDDGDDEPVFHIGFTLNEGRYRDTPNGREHIPFTNTFAHLRATMRGSHGETRWADGELEANARLIAAAPDLYAALLSLVEMRDREDRSWQSDNWTAARSALAKATSQETDTR